MQYAALAEGENNLSLKPCKITWCKAIASLTVSAYKAAYYSYDHNFNYNVAAEHYSFAWRHGVKSAPDRLPGIEQTFSVAHNKYQMAYDLVCVENFNRFILHYAGSILEMTLVTSILCRI